MTRRCDDGERIEPWIGLSGPRDEISMVLKPSSALASIVWPPIARLYRLHQHVVCGPLLIFDVIVLVLACPAR